MDRKRVSKIVGLVLIAVSVLFLARRIISLNVDLAALFCPTNLVLILAVSLFSVVVIFLGSFCWRMCLDLFVTEKIPIAEAFSSYAKSNIMKYLPGNVGQYVGRQFYGARFGISQYQLAIASVIEIAYSALTVLSCAFCFSAENVIRTLSSRISPALAVGIVTAGAVGLFAVCVLAYLFREKEYIRICLELLQSPRFWSVFFACAGLNMLGAVVTATGFIFFLYQYAPMEPALVPLAFSASFLAIFVGYITPGVPGGIGVRESVLIVLLSTSLPGEAVILAAFSHRAAMILVDLFAVPVSEFVVTKFRREGPNK